MSRLRRRTDAAPTWMIVGAAALAATLTVMTILAVLNARGTP